MRRFGDKLFRMGLVLCGVLVFVSAAPSAFATPFGQGKFGAGLFGSQTSLTIALGGNVSLSLTPSGGNFSGNGSNTVTVTSNDTVGYSLYIYAPSGTSLVNGSATIAASSNSSPASLATNTWGYNTTGSTTNFMGITATPVLLKTASGPYESGDTTTVTYGVLADGAEPDGSYTATVTYTAVALNE
ncbi:MAG TPA: hypothetical protein VLE99_04885 [Candidatus Saccharimonadales bacterium]|nr:hypothetical protein [Candidatus Saccharimonadales bacterium]